MWHAGTVGDTLEVCSVCCVCNVYSMCFGTAEERGISFKKNPLPEGVELDIAEPGVLNSECFKNPESDQAVRATAEKGRVLAAEFFASPKWASRYNASQRTQPAIAVKEKRV